MVAGVAVPDARAFSVHTDFLEAIGIQMPLAAFTAGMFFAVAGGFIALAHTPPDDRLDKWATLGAALMIGLMAAIIHPHIPLISSLPAQAVMCVAGLGSRKAIDRARNHDFSLPGAKK